MIIRAATTSDIPIIVNCWQEIDHVSDAQRPFGGDSADKPEHAQYLLKHTLPSPNAAVLVATEATETQKTHAIDNKSADVDHIIGTISGHVFDKPAVNLSKVGVIYGLWVDEKHRQQGLGQTLLTTLENTLKDKGAQSFQVGWDSPNKLAEAWWQKRGYSAYEVIASKII